MAELLLKVGVVAVFAVQGWQIHLYLGYQRMLAELDEYESRAIDKWRSPLLPMVYQQRREVTKAMRQQRVVLLINGVCCLAMLWAASR